MIEYLEQLKKEKQWIVLVDYAERLIRNKGNSPYDLMRINSLLTFARLYLGEYRGAVTSGELAIAAALDLEDWDDYGTTCLNVGVALERVGEYQNAANYILKFLERVSYYQEASLYESIAWYNLGQVYQKLGLIQQSASAMEKALQVAVRLGNKRDAHGIRQALTTTYLGTGQLERIPRLLAKCSTYLSRYPEKSSKLWHLKLRTEYALRTGRYLRARLIALRGLIEAANSPVHQFEFQMLLALIAQNQNDVVEAFGHASAARKYAVALARVDYETEATQFIYQIVSADPSVPQDATRYYVNDGLQSSSLF